MRGRTQGGRKDSGPPMRVRGPVEIVPQTKEHRTSQPLGLFLIRLNSNTANSACSVSFEGFYGLPGPFWDSVFLGLWKSVQLIAQTPYVVHTQVEGRVNPSSFSCITPLDHGL